MNRATRRADKRAQQPPSIGLRRDLTPVLECLQCTPELLLSVVDGGLFREVRHAHGCSEFAAKQRRRDRQVVSTHGQ